MTSDPDQEAARSMEQADEANGEGDPPDDRDDEAANDTERRYGHDESPT